MPAEIQRLTTAFLSNPVKVEVSRTSSTAETIVQMLVKAPHEAASKRDTLRKLLRTQTNVRNGIVFANRKTTVALLEKSLRTHGFNAGALHGDMDQSARLKMLAAFRNNEVTYLIASDVAARGLDIPEVSHVFNYDVPTHAEDYVHRVGRTGRAGREGQAFTLLTKEEAKYWKAIEALIKKEVPYFDLGDGADDSEEAHAPRERKPRHPKSDAKAPAQPRAPKPVHAPRDAPPKQQPKPEPRASRHPQRNAGDAADSHGFHDGNMPAFLMRSVKVG
jgi:superfamily II DNA/RNA helicase